MTSDVLALTIALHDAAALLGRVDEPRWSAGLAALATRLEDSDEPQDRREALADLLGLYAGVGSLNDLVLQDAAGVRQEQAELERLKSRIFELAHGAL